MADIAPLKKFQLFKKLPLELQLMIWDIACNEPRVVVVRGRSVVHPTGRVPPAVLHACRLSRRAARRAYTNRSLYLRDHWLMTIFNNSADTLYIAEFEFDRFITDLNGPMGPGLRVLIGPNTGIRSLALDLNVVVSTNGMLQEQFFEKLRWWFPDLEVLTLVAWPSKGKAGKSIMGFEPAGPPHFFRFKEKVGRLQVNDLRERLMLEMARAEEASNGTATDGANSNATVLQVARQPQKKLPEIIYGGVYIERSTWVSRHPRVRELIRTERRQYLY